MKFHWKRCDTNWSDTDLIVTMDDGRRGLAAFVRPVGKDIEASEYASTGWVARSMVGDFPDELVALPTRAAAMEKAKREFPAMWIGATEDERERFFE